VSSAFWEHLYFEIAMSLGNSLDLKKMLKESVSTYLRKLNCMAAQVYQLDTAGCRYASFELVYSMPRRMGTNPAINTLRSLLPGPGNWNLDDFFASLPMVGTVPDGQKDGGEMHYYLMELPDFGLLALIKSGPPFDGSVLKALAPLNIKLARSCVSCLKAEQAEQMNEALQVEIVERVAAEKKFRRIFENAVEGMFQSTTIGGLEAANPAYARILGYDSVDDLMDSVQDIRAQLYFQPEERDELINMLTEKEVVAGHEIQMRRKDGGPVWVSVSARLVQDHPGGPTYFEGILEDVGMRRRAEKELRQAKEKAEELSRLKSEFLSMVSHELRTPLTSILGFSKIMKRQFESGEHADAICSTAGLSKNRVVGNLDIIASESSRLTELINNVLDLARLESGRFEWKTEQVSMNEVLEHCMELTAVLFDDKGLKLRSELEDSLPAVRGDRDRLMQVCINLLSNAAKFTVAGSVICRARRRNGDLLVEVADTGIGIPPKEAESIFDKFRQLGNTLTDKPKGSGLGLPICKEIVEHHGGEIGVRAVPEEGSVFWFTVPIAGQAGCGLF